MKYLDSYVVRIPSAPEPPMRPEREPPKTDYDEKFYQHVELIKPPGRRTKRHSWDYQITVVPWKELNKTELLAMCLSNVDTKTHTERWGVLHRGMSEETIIGIITGKIDPKELPENPIHRGRQKLQILMYENWKHIWSQVRCNTFCWECSDVKALECTLENYYNLPRDPE